MSTVEAILLGIAQDGGVSHAGCRCPNCRHAWADPAFRQYAVCLGLVDRTSHQAWLVDATPDFREQLNALHNLASECSLAGILLTHVHVGHYGGLIHLGWERDLRAFVMKVDIALVDATFFSADELPQRSMRNVPHPLVTDTVKRLAGVESDVRLIHLNHTNPLLSSGPQRDWLTTQGIRVGAFGDRWSLG